MYTTICKWCRSEHNPYEDYRDFCSQECADYYYENLEEERLQEEMWSDYSDWDISQGV